jgi:hypothetical protein
VEESGSSAGEAVENSPKYPRSNDTYLYPCPAWENICPILVDIPSLTKLNVNYHKVRRK